MNAQKSRLKALDPPTDEDVCDKLEECLTHGSRYIPFMQTLHGMLPFAHAKKFVGTLMPEGTTFPDWTPPQRTANF